MDRETRLHGGRYVVKGLLGEGSQGATYEATDGESARTVAIKRFDVRGARSWKDVELAEREIRVLASLDHPLVPRYVEHFEEDGALYLVMEKVEGETLEAIRRREGALPEVEVRRFLASADRAFTYLHGRGAPVVHRDVKPGNVVRRPDGSYVFVDFGAVSDRLLRHGSSTVVGTAGYMAPEQLQGRSLVGSDVYAVGATALAALTGIEPGDLPHKGLRVDVRTALDRRASPELVSSLERMLEPDPDLRAPSVGAALEAPLAPPLPPRPLAAADVASEDAAVKSICRLFWALWGLGWVIVPIVFGALLDVPTAIPVVMFGWLAAILVVTWHKGAVVRAALRAWRGEGARPPTLRRRVEVDALPPGVRVDASAARREEVFAESEADADAEKPRRGAR